MSGEKAQTRVAFALLAVAILVFAALAIDLTSGVGWVLDEPYLWAQSRGLDPGTLLSPHAGHLLITDRLAVAAAIDLVGDHALLKVLHLIGASLAATLLYLISRERIGPWAALLPAVLLLFLGQSGEIAFTTVGSPSVWAVALGLGALLALERGHRHADIVAAALLLVAAVSHSTGLPFIVGAAVLIVFDERRFQRVWIVALPALSWLVWSRLTEEAGRANFENLTMLPEFAWKLVAGAFAAMTGFSVDPTTPEGTFAELAWGYPLLAVAVVALAFHLRKHREIRPQMWAFAAMAIAFWAAVTVAASEVTGGPTASRYLYPALLFMLLLLVEGFRGTRPGVIGLGVLGVGLGVSLVGQTNSAREFGDGYRQFSVGTRVQLAAIEIGGEAIDRDYSSNPLIPDAGQWLDGVADHGTFSGGEAFLISRDAYSRADADRVLREGLGVELLPSELLPSASRCQRSVGDPARFELPPGGALLRVGADAPDTSVLVGRYGNTATVQVGELGGSAGLAKSLPIPADNSDQPWFVELQPPPGRAFVCPR